jgi:hypothetical protein
VEGFDAEGPCLAGSPCSEICLDRYPFTSDPPWLLSGLVSAEADLLRIVFASDDPLRYPLTGPLLPGYPEWRVFMLGVGRRSYRRLELLQAGRVIAHADQVPRLVAEDHCVLTYEWPKQAREFNECFDDVERDFHTD